ncbi:MAG: hypothetical protein ACOYXM_16175 [Actinomycetota bacterium]
MAWVFLAIGVLLVFAIAAAFVGSEAFRLGHEAPAAIFDLDEAVYFVAEDLSPDAQARVTYDDVRRLVLAALDHLRSKGLGALPGEDVLRGLDRDVVVADDEVLAVALGAVDATALEVDDDDAAEVVRALLRHLDQIGAFGPRA